MIFVLLAACDLVLGLDDYHAASSRDATTEDAGGRDAAAPFDAGDFDAAFDAMVSPPDATVDAGIIVMPPPPPELAGNAGVTCAIDTSDPRRPVYCWGYSGSGALGDNGVTALMTCPDGTPAMCLRAPATPVQQFSAALGDVVAVFGRERAFCAIYDGTSRLACWGEFRGVQTDEAQDLMTTGGAVLSGVVSYDATGGGGGAHACAVLGGGEAFCWGDNSYGQLGATTGGPLVRPDFGFPVITSSIDGGLAPGFVEVATPLYHTCALEALPSGRVFCWGRGENGGWPSLIGDDAMHPTPVTEPRDEVLVTRPVVQIRAGARHACALDVDGRVWCWGDPALGRLGGAAGGRSPNRLILPRRIVTIATSQDNTCAVADDGRVHCWGSNLRGVSGANLEAEMTIPIPLMMGEELATTVGLGSFHGCFRTTTGDDYCWGWNNHGQLGDPTEMLVERFTPVRVDFSP